MRLRRASSWACALALAVAGCSAPAPRPTPGEAAAPEVPAVVRPVVAADRGPEEMLKAVALLKAQQFAQAEANFEEILRVRPDIAEAAFNLGWTRYRLGRPAPAAEALRAGLEVSPGEVDAWLLLALVERELGQFAEAEASYRAGMALSPDDPRLHFNAGILYDLYLLRSADALRHYRRYQALQTTPDARVAGWIAVLERREAR